MEREGEHFCTGEKEVGRAIVNKESMAFHWLSPCQERRGVFLLPFERCYCYRTKLGSARLTGSKANLLTVGCGEGNIAFITGVKQGELAAHAQKS